MTHASRVVRHGRLLDPVGSDHRPRRRSRSSWASPTTTSRHPTTWSDLEELRRDGPVPRGERAAGVHRGRGRPDRQAGHLGQGHIGARRSGSDPRPSGSPPSTCRTSRPEPEVDGSSARFVQTVGGRMGLPTPRPVRHKTFVQFWLLIAWTTLALTLNADGSSSHELAGASPFPRHWIYDDEGHLVEKSGVVDFATWFNDIFGNRTPWGDLGFAGRRRQRLNRPRAVSCRSTIMSGGQKPRIRSSRTETRSSSRASQGRTCN